MNILLFILGILLGCTYTYSASTEELLADLEKTLNVLEKTLKETEINPKKLAIISKKMNQIRKDIKSISSTEKGKYSYSNMLELFVYTMSKPNLPETQYSVNVSYYTTIYEELLKVIAADQGKDFAESYMKNAEDLMNRHTLGIRDRIRFILILRSNLY